MLWLIFVITCGSFSWDEPAGVFFIVCRCISNYQDGDFIRLTCSTLPHCYACLISAFLSIYIVVFSVFSDLRGVYCIGIGEMTDHHSWLYSIITVNSSSDTSIMNISLSTDQRGHIVFIVLVKYIHQDLDFQRHSLSITLFTPRYSRNIANAGAKHQPTNQPTNPMSNVVVLFIKWVQLRWEVIACFAEIGTIADHHCLNFLFIIIINYKKLWRNKHCGQLMIDIGYHVPR